MSQPERDPAYHPAWCDPAECTTPPQRPPLGILPGGAHRSTVVGVGLDVVARGEAGTLTAQLLRAVRPGSATFLVWLINGEQVGQQRIEDAAALALLIASGLNIAPEP